MKVWICVLNVVSCRFSDAAHLRSNSKLVSTISAPSDAIARGTMAAAQVSFDSAARLWCFVHFVIVHFLRVFRFSVEQADQG